MAVLTSLHPHILRGFTIILLASLAALFAPDIYAITVEVITERGNAFVISKDPPAISGGNGTGHGNGTATINGMGINSRLVHSDHGGEMIHGSGYAGRMESIKPYHYVSENNRFAAVLLDDDIPVSVDIPRFYHGYRYDGNTLRPTSAEPPNILGPSDTRKITGNNRLTLDDGMTFTGMGRTIVRLNPYDSIPIILSGDASDGTTVRIVHSPYDLMTLGYAGPGFILHHCSCTLGPLDINVPAGSTDDSVKYGELEYEQSARYSVYHGRCCRNSDILYHYEKVTMTLDLTLEPRSDGYIAIRGDTTRPVRFDPNDIVGSGTISNSPRNYNRIYGFNTYIYDSLPVREVYGTFSGSFEERIILPDATNYLVIDSAGGTTRIRGTILAERNFVDISGLPEKTAYKIIRDKRAIATGITTSSGTISLPAFEGGAFREAGGTLELYPDSMTHVREPKETGTIILDHLNGESLVLPDSENTIYNIHAYVKIPVLEDIVVSDAGLDDTLELDYLDGEYSKDAHILYPVIPSYKTIRMTINGLEASLHIADVLGGSGLKITDSVSSRITVNNPDEFVHSIESVVGTVAYMIAPFEGTAKAHLRATVSGESEITNTLWYLERPPRPPPADAFDPLSTWVEIYVNGEPVDIDGSPTKQIFFSDRPAENHTSDSTATSAYHTVRFSYDTVTIFDTISVPVSEADFVEFYFYNRIEAYGSIPELPAGFAEYRRAGTAVATAIIESASINTSM